MDAQSLEFESAPPYKNDPRKPATGVGPGIFKNNFVKTLSTIFNFRKPVIVKGTQGWYIRYYYRIPEEVRHLYDNKKWLLFRDRADLNRRKGQEREIFAEYLRSSIERRLMEGENPFEADLRLAAVEGLDKRPETMTATDAMLLFLEAWKKRGLDQTSMAKYTKVVNRFIGWLAFRRIPYTEITNISQSHVETFLSDMKREHGFGNREYNNHYDFLRTVFNYLKKKKYISESPMSGIDKLKSKSTKHRYYDDKSLADITRVLELYDPYTLLAFRTIYYLCVRSEKELKFLKIGNINWEQNKILADETKGSNERYIPMDENLKALFIDAGIDKYPADYYVFGPEQKPSPEPFGKGYFTKRFAKARDKAGLSQLYSMYGAKHTRVVHLKQAGLDDGSIMKLTGHTDFTSYAKYLRDIGLDANPERINKVSRKI